MPHSITLDRPPSLTQYASYLALQVAKASQRPLGEGLAQFGLRAPLFAVLCAVSDLGPLTQQQLADRLDIDKSHMVGFVDELDERGLVVRRKDPHDRRCHRIHLTQRGRATLPALHRVAATADVAAREALTQSELGQLVALLDRVLAAQDAYRVANPVS